MAENSTRNDVVDQGTRSTSPTSSDDPKPPSMQEDYIFPIPWGNRYYPLAKSVGNPTTGNTAKLEDKEAWQELGYRVYELKEPAARAIYADLTTSDETADFLNGPDSGYDNDNETWVTLPADPTSQSDLCGPFVKIMNAIIQHFHPTLPEGVSREAVDSHRIPLIHDNGTLFTTPGICIKAAGPSFELPEHADGSLGLGYTNVTTVVDVQPDAVKGKRMVQSKRLGVYNRQIFVQQPNRHFARSLIVTEKIFRLVHYDRSGLYVTPLFDVHKDAPLFVQFVVGLSSSNERHLGLDTSVQWTIDEVSGKKVSGTIEVLEKDEATGSSTPTVYDLDMNEPPYVRPDIRGRGTVAWHAFDRITREPVLIKDAWHTDSREAECEYLMDARGIPGIVEVILFQDHIVETAHYRPPGFRNKEFRNRTKLRVAMKKYGRSVWFFTSRLQLLLALRDALIGHHTLFEKGIIHRDVSVQNLLLGLPTARDGYRGVLIDLDMACRTEDCKSSVPADPHIGTRVYQSVSVIHTLTVKPAPPQDYTDELESFFYVLCHLIYTFRKPGEVQEKVPGLLQHWDMDNLPVLALSKQGFILRFTQTQMISPYWGEACETLLEEVQAVIRDVTYRKSEIRASRDLDAEAKLEAYGAMARNHTDYYEKVKSAFDKAIGDLEREGLNADELEQDPLGSCAPPHATPSVAALETPHPPPASAPPPVTNPLPALEAAASSAAPTIKKRPSEDSEVTTSAKRVRKDPAPESSPPISSSTTGSQCLKSSGGCTVGTTLPLTTVDLKHD